MAQQTKKRKKKKNKNAAGAILIPLILLAAGGGVYFASRGLHGHDAPAIVVPGLMEQFQTTGTTAVTTTTTETTTTLQYPAEPVPSTETLTVEDTTKVLARNSLLLECMPDGSSRVIASRNPDAEIYPASMTKMMTLVTFADLCGAESLDQTVLMDAEVIAEQERQMAYVAGFSPNEACRIKDLVYAMMLPSGADAAVMLATYAAGSEAAFVEHMNELAAEMGLAHTHFDNVTGLHEDTHVSTLNDLSRILMYAIREPFCAEAMSTLEYNTAATAEHPSGIRLISTTLSRMVGNELESLPDPLHVRGGKTGFTNPAGQCLATWAQSDAGRTYLCLVAGSTTFQPLDAVGDVLTLYQLTGIPYGDVQRITVDEADLPLYEHY